MTLLFFFVRLAADWSGLPFSPGSMASKRDQFHRPSRPLPPSRCWQCIFPRPSGRGGILYQTSKQHGIGLGLGKGNGILWDALRESAFKQVRSAHGAIGGCLKTAHQAVGVEGVAARHRHSRGALLETDRALLPSQSVGHGSCPAHRVEALLPPRHRPVHVADKSL